MRESRNRTRLLAWCVPIALALLAPVSPAVAGPADLKVLSVKAAPGQLKPLHVGGTVGEVKLVAKLKNVGSGATVKEPVAQVRLMEAGGLSFDDFNVAEFRKIRPGDGGTVKASVDPRRGPTTYTPQICVSRNGELRQDSRFRCKEGPEFAAVAANYDGSVSLELPILGYAKIFSLAGPVFGLDERASSKRGKFVYNAMGAIEHTVSGSSGLCSISGSKSASFAKAESELVLDKSLQTYRGGISHIDNFPATQTCNGVPLTVPIRTTPLNIGPERRDPPGLDEPLVGTSPVSGATYKWNLTPR